LSFIIFFLNNFYEFSKLWDVGRAAISEVGEALEEPRALVVFSSSDLLTMALREVIALINIYYLVICVYIVPDLVRARVVVVDRRPLFLSSS